MISVSWTNLWALILFIKLGKVLGHIIKCCFDVQHTVTCTKLTVQKFRKRAKYVKVNNWGIRMTSVGVVLVSVFATLTTFKSLMYRLFCWLSTKIRFLCKTYSSALSGNITTLAPESKKLNDYFVISDFL